MIKRSKAHLLLEDGSIFEGESFGASLSVAGEVVFNTGMVGYPESMTDPSYRGQILSFTYPLIGNYGIPVNGSELQTPNGLSKHFESDAIQIKGLIVSFLSPDYSHWSALDSLDNWMRRNNIPGITGIDTRSLTKRLRTKGCMLGKLLVAEQPVEWDDPNTRNLVAEVSVREPKWYHAEGDKKIVLVDLGVKNNIIRSLLSRGVSVLRVPWDYDWVNEDVDGVLLSNGPGDPKMCTEAIDLVRRGLEKGVPIFGICLGNQLLALAAGGDTYKLKYGHRGQNQPCIEVGSKRCFITSQNHGYAVDEQSLSSEWLPWFFNANDGTNEGIRHKTRAIFSVQYHPEATPGPSDTNFLFDTFVQSLNHVKQAS
jgi:carbamoyl-phosphate synthase small subunit